MLAFILIGALLTPALVAMPSAQAQSGFSDQAVSFGGVNGRAETVRAAGDQVWVAGQFNQAFDADLVTSHPRANVAVFDFNTGDVMPFVVDTNAKVNTLETNGVTTTWIGGDFTEIAGQPQQYMAAVNIFTGELSASFDVTVDAPVDSLHYNDGFLYIGGEFSFVNGPFAPKLVRVDPVTGALDPSFSPHPNDIARSIDTYGDQVYAAGWFEEVGVAPAIETRRWIAGFDAATGLASLPDYFFAPLGPGESQFKKGLRRVHVSPDGNYLYTADQRNDVTKLDRVTGEKLWQVRARGDIQEVVAHGDLVYVGTHDGFLVEDDQRLLFALDAATGEPANGFMPLQNSFFGTMELHISQGALVAVGDFTTVNGVASARVAVFHGPDWNGATPLSPPLILGDVNCNQIVNVADALIIAQYRAGLRTESGTCPLTDSATQIGPGADVNNNGIVNVADALLVAQCSAGLPNVLCPEV